jgi:hypothetical protein
MVHRSIARTLIAAVISMALRSFTAAAEPINLTIGRQHGRADRPRHRRMQPP